MDEVVMVMKYVYPLAQDAFLYNKDLGMLLASLHCSVALPVTYCP